jgi:hypothetical protein
VQTLTGDPDGLRSRADPAGFFNGLLGAVLFVTAHAMPVQEAARSIPNENVQGALVDARAAPRPGFEPSIDIDGDRCIIGIHNDEVAPDCGLALSDYVEPTDPGRASVYSRTEEGWRLEADLEPIGSIHRVGFGHRVALDGRTAVVTTRRSLSYARYDGEVHIFDETEPGGGDKSTASYPTLRTRTWARASR